jgi:hypothetical protein
VSVLKRLDEFFEHEEIQEAKSYPLPTDNDVTISIVCFSKLPVEND